jgi:replicative DNA helicase
MFGDLLEPAIARVDEFTAGPHVAELPTGFIDLDEVTGGLSPGSLTVIASRPGVGRSTMLLDIVRSAAIRHHRRSVLFCLDRTVDEVVTQILCAEAKIRRAAMQNGRMSDEDWDRLAKLMHETTDAPLLINTTPGASLSALCDHALAYNTRAAACSATCPN